MLRGGVRTLLLLLATSVVTQTCRADDDSGRLIQRFDGHYSLTTSDFTVPDGWEIRWRSPQVLSVGVIRRDNTVVAGATGRDTGSLYLPQGGTYRIRVKGEDPIPWDVSVLVLPPTSVAAAETPSTFFVPTPGPTFVPDKPPSVPPPLTNSATASAPPAAPALPTQFSSVQQRAVVTVKGSRAEGIGFLVKTPAGPVVMTSLRLLANNPNLEILTKAGSEIKTGDLQGASDRDLAMIGVHDNGYTYLEPEATGAVQVGDPMLTQNAAHPSLAVQGVGPLQLDFRFLRAPVGSPLLSAKTGRVVAMEDQLPRVTMTTGFESENFPDRENAVSRQTTAVGLRLDTVPQWIACPWDLLATETKFLDDFHQRSRCLDSYLNADPDDDTATAKLYRTDDKIKSATETFTQDAAGGDRSQRNDSLRALLFELGLVANTDLDQVSKSANFTVLDQARAKDELAYRQALLAELDTFSNQLNRFDTVVTKNN